MTDPPVLAPPSRGRAWSVALAVVAMVSLVAAALGGLGTGHGSRAADRRGGACLRGRPAERRSAQSRVAGRAVAAYERAIALDPSFAPAHAAWRTRLVVRGVFGGARPDDSYPRAAPRRAPGRRARPHAGRARMSRSGTCACSGTATGAVRRRAIAARWRSIPSAPRAHVLYALLLDAMGRVDEGLRESQTALTLRPDCAHDRTRSGRSRCSGRGVPRRRSSRAGVAIRLDPNLSLAHFWLALALADVGRFDEAMTEALASRTEVGNLPVAVVGYIHGRAGRRAEALEVLRALEAARARSIYVPATDLALVAVGHGRSRRGADVARSRPTTSTPTGCARCAHFTAFDPLRDEPRFKALVAKMKFP